VRNPEFKWYKFFTENTEIVQNVRDVDLGLMIYAVEAGESGKCRPASAWDLKYRSPAENNLYIFMQSGFWGHSNGQLQDWKVQLQDAGPGAL
jgi:hypothetical protein